MLHKEWTENKMGLKPQLWGTPALKGEKGENSASERYSVIIVSHQKQIN